MKEDNGSRLWLRRVVTLLGVGLSWGLAQPGLAAPPAPEWAFFDVPTNLVTTPIPLATAQLLAVPGYPNDTNRLTLAALVYKPADVDWGPGPYPTIMVVHGSGGMWSSDMIGNGVGSQFENWAEVLTDAGFICIVTDSYNPRGIPGNFAGKRPHFEPANDDAIASPNYERPKDVVAVLDYLVTHPDVDTNHVGLLAFSHGSQTALNAMMDPSIEKWPYTVSFVTDNMGGRTNLVVPDPVMIPDHLPFPKICSIYYPGSGHFGYHGSSQSTETNRYMPDRRTRVIMFHGTEDTLMGVDDTGVTPMTGNLYPIYFNLASAAHAAEEGIDNPVLFHAIFDLANHSFDNETIEPEMNWNTMAEDVDEKAKRLARDETMKWFRHFLQPIRLGVTNLGAQVNVDWRAHKDLTFQACDSLDLMTWQPTNAPLVGIGGMTNQLFDLGDDDRRYFKVDHLPLPVPTNAPNAGFFRPYSDFSL